MAESLVDFAQLLIATAVVAALLLLPGAAMATGMGDAVICGTLGCDRPIHPSRRP